MVLNKKLLLEFSLYLFIFSIPFGEWSIISSWSLSGLTGLLFGLFAIIDKKNFSIRYITGLILPLFLWLFWCVITTFLYNYSFDRKFNNTFFQIIIMFWLFVNIFYNSERIRLNCLFIYVLSFAFISILYFNDIGVEIYFGRVTVFGTNSNLIGLFGVFSILGSIYLFLKNMFGKLSFAFLLLIPLFLPLISGTASRGAFFSLVIGLGVLIFTLKGKLWQRVSLGIIGLTGAYGIFKALLQNEYLSTRLNALLKLGDESRISVWKGTVDLFIDNLIYGVGTNGYREEIVTKIGIFKDPHNVYLFILVTTGIIGGIIFLCFLISVFNKILNSYRFSNENIGLVFLALVLFTWAKGGGTFYDKTMWYFLAFSVSMGLKHNITKNSVLYEIEFIK